MADNARHGHVRHHPASTSRDSTVPNFFVSAKRKVSKQTPNTVTVYTKHYPDDRATQIPKKLSALFFLLTVSSVADGQTSMVLVSMPRYDLSSASLRSIVSQSVGHDSLHATLTHLLRDSWLQIQRFDGLVGSAKDDTPNIFPYTAADLYYNDGRHARLVSVV